MTKNEKIIYSCWLILSLLLVYSALLIDEATGSFVLRSIHSYSFFLGFGLFAAWLIAIGSSAKLSLIKSLGAGLGAILILLLGLGLTGEAEGLAAGVSASFVYGIVYAIFTIVVHGIRKLITRK